MAALIEESEPPRDRVFADLAREVRDGHVVPVLIGAASRGNGITRLLKALRHETPGLDATLGRLGVAADGKPLAQVLRTIHTAHGGKLSVARVLSGGFADGDLLAVSSGGEARIAGLSRLLGQGLVRVPTAVAGDCLAFGRLDPATTGAALGPARGKPQPVALVEPHPP